MPDVVGVRLTGRLREGVTATDLALTVTENLRSIDLADRFVEFFGPGVAALSAGDRAVVANMTPEFGGNTVRAATETCPGPASRAPSSAAKRQAAIGPNRNGSIRKATTPAPPRSSVMVLRPACCSSARIPRQPRSTAAECATFGGLAKKGEASARQCRKPSEARKVSIWSSIRRHFTSRR